MRTILTFLGESFAVAAIFGIPLFLLIVFG